MTLALALRPEPHSGGEQRRLTYDDLQQLPDDEGLRYELLDGELLVSPAPRPDHQDIVGSLYVLLRFALPPDLKVYVAPTDWYVSEDTVLEPDLLVVPRSGHTNEEWIEVLPVLVVEVLSPSTRSVDLGRKKQRYAKEGVAWYWVVDPAARPELTMLRLQDGDYVVQAVVAGQEAYETIEPFGVTVSPGNLLY